MKSFSEIEELDGSVHQAWEVNDILKRKRLELIAIKTIREVNSSGSFEDVFMYLIGKAVEPPEPIMPD